MAIGLISSNTYEGGYVQTHTMTDFDASGTDTFVLQGSYNRNPAADVTARTIEGVSPTTEISATTVNQNSVVVLSRLINNAAVTCVTTTPAYRQEAMIGMGLSGVDQSTPVASTYDSGSQWGSSPNASRTGTAGNWFIVFIAYRTASTLTLSAGMTLIEDFDHSDPNLGQCFAAYVECTGSAQTVGATAAANNNHRFAIIEVTAATGGASPNSGLLAMF